MHGGKGDKLITNKNGFSNKSVSPLSNMGITKPSSPLAPKALIEKKEDIKKETTKKEK